jgi:hypothetical protein
MGAPPPGGRFPFWPCLPGGRDGENLSDQLTFINNMPAITSNRSIVFYITLSILFFNHYSYQIPEGNSAFSVVVFPLPVILKM